MKKIFAILVILVAALPAWSGTLADFENYLKARQSEITELTSAIVKNRPPSELIAKQQILIGHLTDPDAPLRRIEFNGTSVEIDYGWLAGKAATLDSDPDTRLVVLEEIGERLGAALMKVEELQSAEASDLSKDESKQVLGKILSRTEFQKPPEPEESLIDRIMKSIDNWMKEVFPKVDMPEGTSEGMRSTSVVLQFVLYGIVIGVVGYLLIKFAPFFASKLRRRQRETNADRVIMGDRIGFDENATTLFGEAELLARNGDLRGAVRKGYIAMLCELSDRKLVGLARHKTNRDYLRDVRKHRTLFHKMNDLTGSFERHWYGHEETTSSDWEDFRDGYRQTMESSRSV